MLENVELELMYDLNDIGLNQKALMKSSFYADLQKQLSSGAKQVLAELQIDEPEHLADITLDITRDSVRAPYRLRSFAVYVQDREISPALVDGIDIRKLDKLMTTVPWDLYASLKQSAPASLPLYQFPETAAQVLKALDTLEQSAEGRRSSRLLRVKHFYGSDYEHFMTDKYTLPMVATGRSRGRTFIVNTYPSFTVDQAINLLKGRQVGKLSPKPAPAYSYNWYRIDPHRRDRDGNHKLIKARSAEQPGFQLHVHISQLLFQLRAIDWSVGSEETLLPLMVHQLVTGHRFTLPYPGKPAEEVLCSVDARRGAIDIVNACGECLDYSLHPIKMQAAKMIVSGDTEARKHNNNEVLPNSHKIKR